MIEILKEIILDFQNEKLITGIKRHIDYEIVKNKAFICIGVRRCGKSTLLNQIIDNLYNKKVKKENIIYINFFDDRLTDLKFGNISTILDAYYSIFPEKKGIEPVYCFFDEIQDVNNWEPFVDRIMRTEKVIVFLTGSSSRMLSKEIATQMRGRSMTYELFPFSFDEFLDYKGMEYKILTSRNRFMIQKAFDEYLIKGGFPEIFDVSDKTRVMIHQEYYKAIIHRDIIERQDTAHPQAVVYAVHNLLNNSASLYTVNRVTHYLKTAGFKISKGFVSSCMEWFQDAYFLFTVKIYDTSIARQNVNAKKIYCIDHGLIKSVSSGIQINSGHLLENLVFIHLRRFSEEIYYYRTKKGKEVDFIWISDQGEKHLVQVCFTIKEQSTFKREISALKEAMEELKIDESTIVTYREENRIEEKNSVINIVPAPKFLLQ